VDPLDALKIETDLKKAMSADILHLREIGTYRGKRCVVARSARG
jgi:small subunit ribosomal protein S13